LTVTPVLCAWLLGGHRPARASYGGPLVRWLRAAAARAARVSLARAGAFLGVAAALLLCSIAAVSTRGWSFLPPFDEGSAQVNLVLPPDTSLETSEALGQRLEEVLLAVPGVRSVVRRTGRAEGDEHVMPVSTSEAIVAFDRATPRSRQELIDDMRARVAAAFPGAGSEVEQPLAHLLSHLLSGVTAQVAIKIAGPDLDVLRRLAEAAEAAVARVPGVRDLLVMPQALIAQVQVEPRRERLAALGVPVAALGETVSLAFGGEPVARTVIDDLTVSVRVLLAPEDRADLEQVAGLLVRDASGDPVRLGDAAHVFLDAVPSEVTRENGQRQIVVQHNIAGRAASETVADLEAALAPVRARLAEQPGYRLSLSGQFEAQQQATRTISLLAGVAVAAMLAILFFHLRSWRLAILVLATRPLAFIGALLWVLASGQDLTIATLVGLIALLGMAARNAILLVDHVLHLARDEGEPIAPALIVRAAQERVVPVLMTALTSGIGLVPLVLAADEPGRELLYPVATAVLGGLITSTLLDFVLLPGLLWLARDELARRVPEARPRM
jgi:Cu/Ag efflux pump CusA